jgi:hypothetical protein
VGDWAVETGLNSARASANSSVNEAGTTQEKPALLSLSLSGAPGANSVPELLSSPLSCSPFLVCSEWRARAHALRVGTRYGLDWGKRAHAEASKTEAAGAKRPIAVSCVANLVLSTRDLFARSFSLQGLQRHAVYSLKHLTRTLPSF